MTRLRLALPLSLLALAVPAQASRDVVTLKAGPDGRGLDTTDLRVVNGTTLNIPGTFTKTFTGPRDPEADQSFYLDHADAFYEWRGHGQGTPDDREALFAGPRNNTVWVAALSGKGIPPYNPDHRYEVLIDEFQSSVKAPWDFLFSPFQASSSHAITGELRVELTIPEIQGTTRYSFRADMLPDAAPSDALGVEVEAKGKIDFEDIGSHVPEDGDDDRIVGRSKGTLAISIREEHEALTVLNIKGEGAFVSREKSATNGRFVELLARVRKSQLKRCKDGSAAKLELLQTDGGKKDAARLRFCGRNFHWMKPKDSGFTVKVTKPE